MMDVLRRWLAAAGLLALTACASLPPPPAGPAVQLANVPAFEQDALQCGPAALASVLIASGVETTPSALQPDLFVPDREGSLQVELTAQTRQHGRVPLLLAPEEAALVQSLKDGQPVLVLLNLGVRSYPIWHYAVVTGFDPDQGYTLNFGHDTPEVHSRRTFLRRWNGADRWAMTVNRVDSPPPHARPAQWIAAAAPLERSQPALAVSAYEAAVKQWPDSALSWAALGGVREAQGQHDAAAIALRQAAQLQPGDAAIANNLASVELARGCVQSARQALATIPPDVAPAAVSAAVQATRAEVAAAGADHCPDAVTR